jgi:inorganic pyrophosphatase
MVSLNKAHPWHGVDIGKNAPDEVTVFVEIVPGDTVKYEIDKPSGYLKIDRPQQYSNVVPANYGFIPRTYCGDNVAGLARENSGVNISGGDGDPLDILVLTEHHIPRGDIILKASPIGGLCLIDNGQADDKIIAVLKGDKVYEQYRELADLPEGVLRRFEHYFLTYKTLPGDARVCDITRSYGRDEAGTVIRAAMQDYETLIT